MPQRTQGERGETVARPPWRLPGRTTARRGFHLLLAGLALVTLNFAADPVVAQSDNYPRAPWEEPAPLERTRPTAQPKAQQPRPTSQGKPDTQSAPTASKRAKAPDTSPATPADAIADRARDPASALPSTPSPTSNDTAKELARELQRSSTSTAAKKSAPATASDTAAATQRERTTTAGHTPSATGWRPIVKPAPFANAGPPAAWPRPFPHVSIPADAVVHPKEIIAVDLPPFGIARVLALGFLVSETSTSPLLGSNITRLFAPSGMTAQTARELLVKEFGETHILPSTIYRPYRPQGAASLEPPKGLPRAKGPCAPERCYGQAMIGWRPELASCARNLAIGVIDTAIEYEHPAFAGRNIHVGSVKPLGTRETAPAWHGTGVLSLLAGEATSGTPGLVPDADFYVADVFFADEAGQPVSDSVSVINALELMDRFKVKIINMSLSGARDPLVERIVERLASNGVVIVAAAGNGGPDAPPSYPAAYQSVIAVTAVNRGRASYRFATRGDYVDLSAPGVDIWTALPGWQEGYQTGTSFAAPFVTATVAAIYRSASRKTKDEMLQLLAAVDLGTPGRDQIYGRGLVQAPASCRPQPPAPADDQSTASRPTTSPPAASIANGLGFNPAASR